MSPLFKIKAQIVKVITEAYPNSAILVSDIVPTPNPALGDMAVPMFKLAKVSGKAPSVIADELRGAVTGVSGVTGAEVAGPYLNLRLNRALLFKEVLSNAGKRNPSLSGTGKKSKIMVEFISPNINKPLHLGHLRNAVLGEALSRLLEASGHKVVRANLLNDRGVGITKTMIAYQKFGNGETPASAGLKGDHLVGNYYVKFDQKVKENPSLEDEVALMLQKWEKKDKPTRALWRKMFNWCVAGQNKTIKSLGIKFDKIYRESALYEEGKKSVIAAWEKGLLQKDEKGNIVARLPGEPDKVVLRADGTAVYITTDIVLTAKKATENKLARLLWVVGSEQDLHLRQLFGIMRLLGFRLVDGLEHVSYGHVSLPEGRMKSREGTVVDVDDLLEHLAGLAAEQIKERHDFLTPKEIDKRAMEIALGAVKFYFLSVGAKNGIVFNPKESLSFSGKTGPYLQYTNARMLSLLRKAADKKTAAGRVDVSRLGEAGEWKLAMHIAQLADVVDAAAINRDPSLVAKYAYDLAKSFSEFYEQTPILKAETQTRRARLSLVRATQAALSRAMYLLAIPAPKEM
jgi:arginyl-tRNA synthetase